jgi:hypothetical protein
MPSLAPRTQISPQVLRRTRIRDLVRRRRQRLTLAPVLPLPANRTFFFAVHCKPFRKIVLSIRGKALRQLIDQDFNGQREHPRKYCRQESEFE